MGNSNLTYIFFRNFSHLQSIRILNTIFDYIAPVACLTILSQTIRLLFIELGNSVPKKKLAFWKVSRHFAKLALDPVSRLRYILKFTSFFILTKNGQFSKKIYFFQISSVSESIFN